MVITNYELRTLNLQVYNTLGQVIYQSEIISDVTQINLSNQPQGIYFYRITTENGTLIKSGKMIIAK
jgi:hypothetical protein